MMLRAQTRTTRQVIASILMLLVFNSCYGWSRHPDLRIRAIVAEQPERIRVERNVDNSKIVLYDPQISGDSVKGFVGHWRRRTSMALDLNEVRSVETRKLSAARTATLIVVGTPFAAVTLLIVACLLPPNSPRGEFGC